jgi:choline dehydrogenase-like flavoprotein
MNFNMLGVAPEDRRSSLGQLSLVYFPDTSKRDPVVSNFYSYRTLLTFKLLKEAPLPQRECLRIMRALMPIFGIITIFHKDYPTTNKYCILRESEGTEKSIKKFYRKLGCWPIKSIRRSPGSSIHYSGTLPMSKENRDLTCDAEGKLYGTRAVYVADGSLISPLPSIFPTFTIMAMADRAGMLVAKKLKNEQHIS